MPDRPNIVFITSHDTGRYLHCYGIDEVHSPNLDRIAGDGCLFTDFFSTSAVCSPARAAMMSGRYPQSNGVLGLTHEPWLWQYNDDVVHLSEALRRGGYHTVMFHHQHEALDIARLSFDDYRAREPEYPVGAMPDPYDHLTAAQVADEFEAWAETDAPRDRPFYAQVGFFETHMPFDFGGNTGDTEHGLHWPEHFPEMDDDDKAAATRNLELMQGAVRNMDEAIGRMYASLERAGLAENTLFVYTTDHGISMHKAKCYLYDAGIGVALVMRWPAGGIVGGATCDWLINNVDVFPTVLGWAGCPVPEGVQGRSFAGFFNDSEPVREYVFAEMNIGGGMREARSVRDRRYKLIRNFNPTRLKELGPSMAYVTCPPVQLFDLQTDPHEYTNLADDPTYAEVRGRLDDTLLAWMKDLDDPVLKGPVPWPYYEDAMRGWGTSKGLKD